MQRFHRQKSLLLFLLIISFLPACAPSEGESNSAPVANSGDDQIYNEYLTVTLNGAGSSDNDGDPLSYSWSIISKPASSQAQLSDATLMTPSFLGDVPGKYIFSLIVSDGKISSTPSSVTVSIYNKQPVANAGEDSVVNQGETVELSGTASSDEDGDPLTYDWAFISKPNGSHAVLSSNNTHSPSFIADIDGEYVLGLIVSDGVEASLLDQVTIIARKGYLISDLDFEAPIHSANSFPKFGFGPNYVQENFDKGTISYVSPTVINNHPIISGQVLSLQPQYTPSGYPTSDSLTIPVSTNGDYYSVELDIVVSSPTSFILFLNSGQYDRGEIEFSSNSTITYNSNIIGSYDFNVLAHMKIEIDTTKNLMDVYINDQSITGLPFNGDGKDLDSLRVYLGGDMSDQVIIDNLKILTWLNPSLSVPNYDNIDSYMIGFELPQIADQFSTGVQPYSEDFFNMTYVGRKNPAGIGYSVPDNGTVHAAFAMFSKALLHHKHGFPFQLVSVEVADYSIYANSSDAVFTAKKRSGEILTHTVSANDLTMNFMKVNFPDNWIDLEYVLLGYGFALDNVVLRLNGTNIGLQPAF